MAKIGFTANRKARLSELQTGTHKTLRLEASFPAYEVAETMLHKRFAKQRIRGEWFQIVFEIEELWDDLMDYQGMRCGGRTDTNRAGPELLTDIDRHPVDIDHLEFILKTIGEPWPRSFTSTLQAIPAL